MNVVVLAAQSWDGAAVPCTFAVEVDGVAVPTVRAPFDTVTLPPGAGAVRVVATPTVPWFWEDEFHLVGTAGDVEPTVGHAAKVTTASVTAGDVVLSRVTVTVSRFRDAAPRALDALTMPPNTRLGRPATLGSVMEHGDFPPEGWTLPDRPGTTFVDVAQPVVGDRIGTVVRDAVGADVECFVLEVAGVAVPKLVAVSWPTALHRDEGADPAPFLVYLHPSTGQNVVHGFYLGGELGPYPWNFDFCYFGLYSYQWYAVDPLTRSPYSKGLPFQVSAAGRQVVTVLPCNAPVGNEVGAFSDAASLQALLLDLQAWMFRRSGSGTPPATLGRTALGAFSSGNDYLAAFLQSPSNRAHEFCTDTLREVLCFDPPGYHTDALIAAALGWSGGPETGRRVALYSQGRFGAHERLLGHPAPAGAFVETSADGTRTAAVLPSPAWRATAEAATGRAWPHWDFQQTHQVIPAMMLTHAMGTSGF